MKYIRQSATFRATFVYYALLYIPTALTVIFVWPADYSIKMRTIITLMVSLWANLGSVFLGLSGLLNILTGMKLMTGKNRGFFLANAVVTVAMQMDMPSDPE